MGRRGRGMGGGRSGGFSGGHRAGGFRPGVGGGRGRSGRNRQPGGYGQVGGFGTRRSGMGGFGSMLPWFLLGRMGGCRRYGGNNPRGGGGCGGCGCLLPLLLVVLGFFILRPNISTSNIGNNTQVEVRESTVDREPIAEGLVNETAYYTDNAYWITNENELIDGMQSFYEQTNVQPHVYITEEINGDPNPAIEDVQAFTENLYDELFTDEAHVLLVFFESDQYSEQVSYHTAVGNEAEAVFDNEAQNILFDYLDAYYYSNLREEAYFSQAFEHTADHIMGQSGGLFQSSTSDSGINWSGIITGVLIFFGGLAIVIFLNNRRQKNKEAEIIDKDDDMTF